MARFVPSPPPNCLSYKAEGRLADQDWQAHFKVPCCGVDPSQLESEEAEVDVRDTQRDREPKRARDLTLRDSCPDNSMQFGTRATAAEPGFMGTWQNADTNLLFRMSQQVLRLNSPKNAGRSQQRGWLLVSGAAGLGAERGSAGFLAGRPAGSARRAGGRLHALPLAAGGLRSGPLSVVAALYPRSLDRVRRSRSARLATRPPPSAVHSHSARPLRPPRAAPAPPAARGSSVSALPGEPPGERQARGRIINHPRPPVPSAR
ncbi:hypothetical protein ACRRTK_017081 [Alexandromys fortis]